MFQVTTHPSGGGCILRIVAPLSSAWHVQTHDEPSSSHLIRGSLKTYCCMWRRWLWWVLLPFNCRYIRHSGGYICCYCGGEISPCGNGHILWYLGTITKRDIWCALSYSKHNNNIQLVDWWRKYDHLQFTWGNPFTVIICQHTLIRNMFHLNRKEYMICERRV